MSQKGGKRLVEICPQCRHRVDDPSARLVSDVCGHTKCRICLLQEINGCLKCAANSTVKRPPEPERKVPLRKSVIMSTLELKSELQDKGTQQVIQQSMQKDIFFPTDIVKSSTGNFFHLKRVISERYYNERGGKEHKSCETEQEILNAAEPLAAKLPDHIVHYCSVHRKILINEEATAKHKHCANDGKPNLKCDICKKAFLNIPKLNRHRKRHLPDPRFQCNVCSKRFKDNYALTTHKRMHTGHKAFTCHVCHIQLKQLWSLKRHLAAHRGEKNYPCTSCNYRFVTKAELTRHMKLHSNSKAYSCSTCGSRFSCQRTLVRHAACHNSTTARLSCCHCDAQFKRKDNLLRHVKNSHPQEEVTDGVGSSTNIGYEEKAANITELKVEYDSPKGFKFEKKTVTIGDLKFQAL